MYLIWNLGQWDGWFAEERKVTAGELRWGTRCNANNGKALDSPGVQACTVALSCLYVVLNECMFACLIYFCV